MSFSGPRADGEGRREGWRPAPAPRLEATGAVRWVIDTSVGRQSPEPSEEEWGRAVPTLVAHGLCGLALDLTDGAGRQLAADVGDPLARAARQETLLTLVAMSSSSVIDVLDLHGIPSVVIKGPAIDWQLRRNARPFVDLDLLVRPRDFGAAVTALGGLGFMPATSVRSRASFDRWCYEGTALVEELTGRVIDLHHHIPPWRWGEGLHLDRLLDGATSRTIAGRRVEVAGPVHTLLGVALHVVADRERPGTSLRPWVDLGRLLPQCPPEEVAAEAQRCDVGWILSAVLRQLPTTPAQAELLGLLPNAARRRGDRARFGLLTSSVPLTGHQIMQAVRLPVPNATLFLAGELFPSPARLREKFGEPTSRRQWWSRSLRLLRSPETGRPDRPCAHG